MTSQEILTAIQELAARWEGKEAMLREEMSKQTEKIQDLKLEVTEQLHFMVDEVKRDVDAKTDANSAALVELRRTQEGLQEQIRQLVPQLVPHYDPANLTDISGGSTGAVHNENNSLVTATGNTKAVGKPPTFNGEQSWTVYKAQFELIATASAWTEVQKACALASCLRSPASDLLQLVPEAKRLDYGSLVAVIDRRYGDEHKKPYYSLQLRTRMQKRGETLQELAGDIERLAKIVYHQCPSNVQDELAAQHFTDALAEAELQHSVRMANCKTLQSALLHAMHYEASAEAAHHSRRMVRFSDVERDSVPPIRRVHERVVHDDDPNGQTIRRNPRRSFGRLRCWNCHELGHIAASCPVAGPRNAYDRHSRINVSGGETGSQTNNYSSDLPITQNARGNESLSA